MKQFMVLCAVLPLLLVIIVQNGLDQKNNLLMSVINDAVFAVADASRKDGKFNYTMLEDILTERYGIKKENIKYVDEGVQHNRGEFFIYHIEIKFDKPMVGLMLSDKDNHYTYVIDSCAASER